MAVVQMKALLETGVHFGHRTRRWNPKMKPYIFTERNGIHIIDLQQTLGAIETAYNLVRDTVARGEPVLFVGTKRQAQEAIEPAGASAPASRTSRTAGWAARSPTGAPSASGLTRSPRSKTAATRGELERLTKKEALLHRRARSKSSSCGWAASRR